MWDWSLGQEDPVGEGVVTHSSILAWRIPWTEEPGGLQFMGLQRVGHDWSDLAHKHCSSIFNFWRKCHTVFHRTAPVYIPTSSPPFSVSAPTLVIFLTVAILKGVKWYFMAFICISVMISDTKHLHMCLLAICMSSLEKCSGPLLGFFFSFWLCWFFVALRAFL